MDQVDSGVKVAVESVIQSESVVAVSQKPEAQVTVSQGQPEASQGMLQVEIVSVIDCMLIWFHDCCFYGLF